MEKIELSKECDYGRGVPDSLIKAMLVADVVSAGTAAIVRSGLKKEKIGNVILAGSTVCCGLTVYMQIARDTLDFKKGGLMGDMHQLLVERLDWDGQGTVLDVGCGAGALSVRLAKAFPEAHVMGVDPWKKEWGFTRDQCVRNAVIEQVDERIQFHKVEGHLPIEDGKMDAVVSAFGLGTVKGKAVGRRTDAVPEALRVLKKGGSFAFLDMFEQKCFYSNMGEMMRELRAEGYAEVHYIPNVENFDKLVPKYMQAPWMLHGAGLLYGKK